MKRIAKRAKETRFVWLKAVVTLLFVLVFIMLFTGAFDRPERGRPESGGNEIWNTPNYRIAALAGDGFDSMSLAGETSAVQRRGDADAGELIPGDILLGRCRLSLVPSLNPHNGWTHAAIYVGNDKLIVASNPRSGVIAQSFKSWKDPKMTWVVYLRVRTADGLTREKAVDFAKDMKGREYDLNWLSKQEDGKSWYCSELIWAAYFNASEGRIDLTRGLELFGVSPDDIFMHNDTVVIGGHFEAKPDTVYSLLMKAFALCILAAGGGILVPHPLFSHRRR